MRLARYRFRLARRVLTAWAIAAALATITALTLHATLAAGHRYRDRWLPTKPVLVARRLIRPGETLDTTNTELLPVPSNQRGNDLLDGPANGRVAATALYAGEPVRAARLVGASIASPGTRLVAIATNERTPPVVVGDRVDVLGASQSVRDGTATGAGVVASAAPVVAVNDQRVVIAVQPSELNALAAALTDGNIVIAVNR